MIAFSTKYSLFEFLIMTISLIDANVTCQHFINDIPIEFLDIFYIPYIDNNLIESNLLDEY
jgi:hypothetical protein